MKLKLKKPIVFFDLETTGTDVNSDRIVEFAGIKFNGDGTQEQMVQRYNPRMPIPKEASDVHGITNHDVEPCPYFTDVSGAPEIANFMRGCDLAGYNITKFDIPLLYNEMQRCGGYMLDITCTIIDCCDIFHKREARDLTAAVKFYTGETFENAHSALDDIQATIKVMDGQLAMYEDLSASPEEIFAEFKDPESVDLAGKLKIKDGIVVLNFGKHKGKPLEALEKGYIQWMLKNNVVGPDAVSILQGVMSGL